MISFILYPLAIRECAWEQVEERLVAMGKALQLIDHEAEEAGTARQGHSGDMRSEEDIMEAFDRVIGRNRLRVEDIERRDNVVTLEAGEERRGIDDCASGDVDEHAPRAEEIELVLANHAARARSQRGEADHSIGVDKDTLK